MSWIEEVNSPKDEPENSFYKCNCGSRKVSEMLGCPSGIYIAYWNAELKEQPHTPDLSEMKRLCVCCFDCKRVLADEEQMNFFGEIW